MYTLYSLSKGELVYFRWWVREMELAACRSLCNNTRLLQFQRSLQKTPGLLLQAKAVEFFVSALPSIILLNVNIHKAVSRIQQMAK